MVLMDDTITEINIIIGLLQVSVTQSNHGSIDHCIYIDVQVTINCSFTIIASIVNLTYVV